MMCWYSSAGQLSALLLRPVSSAGNHTDLPGMPSTRKQAGDMTRTGKSQTGVKKLHRDARREAILTAAARAFVRNGYDATSLEDITSEAGVSRTLLYRHFDTKKEIYLAILNSDQKPPTQNDIPSPDKAKQRIVHLVEIAQTQPDRFRLLFRHAAREPEFRGYMEKRHSMGQFFTNEALKKYIPDDKQRQFAVLLLRDTVISILLTWTDGGCPNPELMPDLIMNVVDATVSSVTGESS
jgi:AcrR family transcriptional regulator